MPPPPPADARLAPGRMHLLGLAALTAVAVYGCYRLAEPLLPGLAWGAALAVVVLPLHRRLERTTGKAGLAAGASAGVVVLGLLVPMGLVAAQLGVEAARAAKAVKEYAGDDKWRAKLAELPYGPQAAEWAKENVHPEEVARSAAGWVSQRAGTVLGGTADATLQSLVAVFVLFFALKDRERLLAGVRSVLPLPRADADDLLTKASDAIHATVYGTVVTGVLQGVTGGLMFWALGLPAPLLWGVVMAVLSILPVLGAFLVWVPAAGVLVADGRWGAAAALVAWGVLMAGPICNTIYAKLAAGRMELHPVPTLVAFVGGLAVFGITGMVLGPAVLAVTYGLIEAWRRRGDGRPDGLVQV